MILFVTPPLRVKPYRRADAFRTHLTLGTLASALGDQAFLRRFAVAMGRQELILPAAQDYPVFAIRFVDLSTKPPAHTIEQHLSGFIPSASTAPLMVCSTATSAQLDEAREVAAAVQFLAPSALRVIGGPHVSVLPVEFLDQSDFQVACFGEGVETLVELALEVALGRGDLSRISGIAYKREGRVVMNVPRRYLLSLDDYPFPSNSLRAYVVDPGNQERDPHEIVHILGGLGCPFQCAFCAQHAVHRGVIRERSPESIFAEIEGLVTEGFKRFAIVQETFFHNTTRVRRFCRLLQTAEWSIEWTAEARADQLDPDLLRLLKSCGFQFIQIGLESGDQSLLDSMGKCLELRRVERLIQWCKELKISTALYVLVGLPGQGWQSILRTATFLREHPPYNTATMHISVAAAVPYPGTKLAAEGSVRLLPNAQESCLNWPDRNPDVGIDEEGRLYGEGLTETDDMTPREICEALLYLDDYGHFLLHGLYCPSYSAGKRKKLLVYSESIFYVIVRRVIRDVIACAHDDLSPRKRAAAYADIITHDRGEEDNFHTLVRSSRPVSTTFVDFLTRIRFSNGFETMKVLSPANRLKWMKLCSLIRASRPRTLDEMRFLRDAQEVGNVLQSVMEGIRGRLFDLWLSECDDGKGPTGFLSQYRCGEDARFAFGIGFHADEMRGLISIEVTGLPAHEHRP